METNITAVDQENSKGVILIAEDDPFLGDLLETKFSSEGFTVGRAVDGVHFWDYLKTQIPNVILLDLMMPDTDGFQVLQQLKADVNMASIPVIVLSNLGGENIDRAMALGAIDYAVKANFVLDEIIAKVSKLIIK